MNQDLLFAFKIFDALPLYGILFDREGTVIAANKTFLCTIGLSRKEVVGMSAEELEPYYIGLKKHLDELDSQQTRTFHGQLARRDGTLFSVEHSLAHISTSKREVIASISHEIVGRSVGEERREAEKKIDQANQRKRQFIANINHEIRTPMNAIVGYAEMLAESDIAGQQRRYVETIRKNSTYLVAIVNDIMELSKLETGKVRVLKSTVNLHVITEQLHDFFADQVEDKNIEFICQVAPDLPKYYVIDSNHCRQILTNLVSNAVKYTDVGTITLSVTGVEKKASWYMLFFQITDTGRGMSPLEQDEIQDLIEQQKEDVTIHDGKCLGLTLSARLARIMGGDLTLESVQGEGSTFTFSLLASVTDESAIQEIGPDPCQQCQQQRGKKRKNPAILVVDDMPEMSHLVKIYFTGTTVKVLEAADREQCLEHAFQSNPDLILMDLNLAGTDGTEITEQLKNDPRTEHIPIIAMTGMMLEKKSYEHLFADFLAKPFHLHELRRIVDKYIQVTSDTACSTDEEKEAVPDTGQIARGWGQKLDQLYREAEMSGSLDAAAELGLAMQKQGLEEDLLPLIEMGKELQGFALDLDIQGVDHLLGVLKSIRKEQ
ncbi:ATP-binding response regulator [Candidatus Electrothrix sp.]|uniref:ATP-binding response regulator n=1 Tax=Candidatus Electrothrix sp. TaxID=2170559 RepID=UPI0040572237